MTEEIRIGVFVCDCGSNIAGVVNVPEVVNYAKGLKNVVFVDEGKWSCSVDALSSMQESIKEHKLNRVVIASCTARTHEPLFKQTVKEAGLNPYLLEFVSIREQVSWVHMNEPEIATQKAKDLVKMGVAKAALLEEGEEIRLPVGKDCMVIGGGMAGMTAALSLANQGFKAVLVEKRPQLGGLLNLISTVSSDKELLSAEEIVRGQAKLVETHPNVVVYTNAEIENVDGYIGNYSVTIKSNGTRNNFDVSTVIVATGMRELNLEGKFFYGSDSRVVTQLELEGILKNNQLGDVKNVVMVNCVGSKNETRGCCNIGCHVSIKNALAIKRVNKEAKVYILYRDLSMVKEEHFHIDAAKAAGVKFLRFPDDRYPEVTKDNENLVINVYDILSGRAFLLSADLLVLTAGFEGDETIEKIKGHLKVSSNAEGFFQERHIKLGPLDFPADGIALCGCAKNPKTLKETIEEGMGAAMRVSIPMNNGYIEAEGIVADIDLANCNSCGLCWKRCPYGAIRVNENKEPQVVKALCKGCGLCAADCPKECISIVHYSDDQVLAQVEAALEENPADKIIAFVCHWCALGGVDMAGVSRLQYPPNARLIRVMCSARVSIKFIQRAFDLGAAGVLVAGCEFPTCHYISGNYAAEKRVNRAKKILAKKGFDPDKLWNIWCSAADGPKFANTMREMVRELHLAKEV
ncbi:MAG: hydrogenase iron-sulfur subunit [Deltaproteobacteria bacterium]|nr:hydrogenase iron-sulfur subunit [Deltaproteobacteria bacterium]MBW2300945.1 hydrogenase iron-sulfur subunit [Deltaproteobacteria bacterium]